MIWLKYKRDQLDKIGLTKVLELDKKGREMKSNMIKD